MRFARTRLDGVIFGLSSLLVVACSDSGMGGTPPPPQEIDAGMAPKPEYPAGPYGVVVGDTIKNETWASAYFDGDDPGASPYDEAPRAWSLDHFWQGKDPNAKLIMLNQAAGWCGPCMTESTNLPALAADY